MLALSFPRARRFDAGERDLLRALAGQGAVALARAQLYEREHTVAQTLQASLLPRACRGSTASTWRRLHAGANGIDVGGDFTTRSRSPAEPGGSRSATSAVRASTPRR